MNIGLYFGSFNPIHNGHLTIGNYCKENYNLDYVFYIVSPQNPFKNEKDLLPFKQRLRMVSVALEDTNGMYAESIEERLPKPSYTVDTLRYLTNEWKKYGEVKFFLIMGLDNYLELERWKGVEELIHLCTFIVIPRGLDSQDRYVEQHKNLSSKYPNLKTIYARDCPSFNISSTFIRGELRQNKAIHGYVPNKVVDLIKNDNLYKKLN